MSDYRAIASVTATLRTMLQDLADVVVPGSRVEAGPPTAQGETRSEPLVRVFLYSVTPHPTLRNVAQPVRRGDGSLAETPVLPLQLHYLLSFIGDDPGLKAQILLGAVMTFLETQPLVLPDDVHAAEQASIALDSDLTHAWRASEQGLAHFVLEPLTSDDLTRLWGLFAHIPYALSVAYRCSLLLLRPAILPDPILPVARPHLSIPARSPPVLTAIVPMSAEAAADLAITVTGAGLGRLAGAVARFDDVEASVKPTGADTVSVAVPAGLPAGNHAIMLVAANGLTNALPFVLLPRIAGPATTSRQWLNRTAVSIAVVPDVMPGQDIRVLLNEMSPPPGQPPRAAAVAADPVSQPSDTVHATLPRLPGGNYLLRVEVDGAISRLTRGAGDADAFDGPLLAVA